MHWGGGEDCVHIPLSDYISSAKDTAQAMSPRIFTFGWQRWDRPVMRNVTEPTLKAKKGL